MTNVARARVVSFFTTLIIIPLVTYLVILFARGYRPDPTTRKFEATGILAATSLPDGAQLIVNGEIKTATNNSLNLPMGEYDVEIKKEGFHPWSKHLKIEKEIVTRASAYLFSNIPTFKAVSTSGVTKPLLSPGFDKVAYFSQDNKKLSLMILEISESPLGLLNREPRLITVLTSTKPGAYSILWSPDSRQLLLQSSSSAQLVDVGTGRVSEASIGLPSILSEWNIKKLESYQRQFNSLPENMQNFFATTSSTLNWSSNDKKLLYTATASATMPDNFLPILPGSSTQTQNRILIPGHTYIFDLEEDRNFDVGPSSEQWLLYPTSTHVYRINKNNIHIKEYDNTNEIVFFAGNLFENFAVPYPSGKQFLVLTNTNPASSTQPNLYTINLK